MRFASVLTGPLLCLAAALPAFAHPEEGENISKVNGAITAEAGHRYGSLSTVNGAIRVRSGAEAASAETVNGSITVEDEARVGALETVNGAIRLGARVVVEGDIEAVNGGLTAGPGTVVKGSMENVNGSFMLEGVEVEGSLSTVNGRVDLVRDVHVAGGLTVHKPSGLRWFGWGTRTPPTVIVGPGSKIAGPLVFEQEVELYLHETAEVGPITGAEPVRFTGERPE